MMLITGQKGIFTNARDGIMIVVKSVHGVPVRVTHERIEYICSRHPEMQGHDELIMEAVGEPDFVQDGDYGARMGVKRVPGEWPSKYVVAVYKEVGPNDGFLLTSYFTRKPAEWRKVLWKR
jgi:hypothetical protein